MKTFTKALVGTVAVGAMALTSTAPAFAQQRDQRGQQGDHRSQQQWSRDRDHRDRDRGISTGDVIAGALIVGGIAAVAAVPDNDSRYDRRVYGEGRSRNAVEQCVNAAENRANRYSYGGRSNVTDVRSITRLRDGYTVRGRIAVNSMGRGWRSSDRTYGRGWNGDYRGWNQQYRGWDAGNFTCRVRYGQVTSVNFIGVRGLR